MKLNTKDFEVKMQKAIVAYEENLTVIRAGQANTAVLAKVAQKITSESCIMPEDSRSC